MIKRTNEFSKFRDGFSSKLRDTYVYETLGEF